ncbi:HEPN domain-containing protein [Paraburkholderia fungorum]|uniref:Uncharacterized protein n=1 Tax=Paraburkholderia fungorum TaxID=134537 RepID=A0A3R7HDZ0_9BURK|nr:HEPN domain-containing protein [Paraburkholderia fungorum]RKF36724.1 hypothetical protein BCY88_35405 [Paraburkholderia fungorum]
MKTTGSYPEEQTHTGTFHLEESGESHEGVLSFGGGHWARLNFKNGAPRILSEGERIEQIILHTETGQSYTLCKCQLSGSVLYADYVFEADIGTPEFDQITVRFHEISEWFLRWQRINGSVGDQLTWTNISKPISVSVVTDDERFTLTSAYRGSIRTSGEKREIHEHVDFSFATGGKKFCLQDLKSKTHELSCLLSILVAYPTTISHVRIPYGDGHQCKVHFVTSARPERNLEDSGFWTNFFIQKSQLDDRWQTIFDHYYRSQYRKVCWVRVAGMQQYEGFWEYEALGYVTLLDKYVSIRSKGATKPAPVPPAATKLAEFRLLAGKSMPSVDEVQLDKLVELASRAFASTPFAFAEKYELAIKETDSDVVKIIALSATDFHQIKKIRDAIAHGDDPGLKEGDYTKVSDIVAKIKLLLTYWALLDFGLTTTDFLQYLKPHTVGCV